MNGLRVMLCCCAGVVSLRGAEVELKSGDAVLTVSETGLRVVAPGGSAYENTKPVELRAVGAGGDAVVLRVTYKSVQADANKAIGLAEASTPLGTTFAIRDQIEAKAAGSFEITRDVKVTKAGKDEGFQSRFSLQSAAAFNDCEFFVPGIWYLDNSKAKPGALGTSRGDSDYLIREDRMPLPVAMLREKKSGSVLSITRIEPDGSTTAADYRGAIATDAGILTSSLGFQGREKTAVTFCHPAYEGERTYFKTNDIWRSNRQGVARYHPVKPATVHHWKIQVGVRSSSSFAQAMRDTWRAAFSVVPHGLTKADIGGVYESSIQLVAHWVKTFGDAAGLPFRLQLPKGELEGPSHYNFQMGFVGQQIPLAYHLLRYGLLNKRPDIAAKGEAMMNFWAANSLTDDGLPRVWYDTTPTPHWRKFETFLRIATDGMSGAIMAWAVMKQNGQDRPQWLHFCTRFGDWLVAHQAADGSWSRAYQWDGSVAHEGKSNTSNAIRFLVDLSLATGDKKYLTAAVKAGDYCWQHAHLDFDYVGGTADNPNVLDKEAGFIAIEAFLALWDATGEKKYLDAAVQAADFTETWAYCWNVPIPPGDSEVVFPASLPTTGYSIIATGHSGADLFLAAAPFFYYRIYLATGDAHYAEFARIMLHATRRHVDLKGSLGYGEPGLCTEATQLSIDRGGRGRGVDAWLPWLSFSMIEPIVRLQEAYGILDTPPLNDTQLAEARRRDAIFSKTRGIVSIPDARKF